MGQFYHGRTGSTPPEAIQNEHQGKCLLNVLETTCDHFSDEARARRLVAPQGAVKPVWSAPACPVFGARQLRLELAAAEGDQPGKHGKNYHDDQRENPAREAARLFNLRRRLRSRRWR